MKLNLTGEPSSIWHTLPELTPQEQEQQKSVELLVYLNGLLYTLAQKRAAELNVAIDARPYPSLMRDSFTTAEVLAAFDGKDDLRLFHKIQELYCHSVHRHQVKLYTARRTSSGFTAYRHDR